VVAVLIQPVEIEAKGGTITIDKISIEKGSHPFYGPPPSDGAVTGIWDEFGNYRGSGHPSGAFDVPETGVGRDQFNNLLQAARVLGWKSAQE